MAAEAVGEENREWVIAFIARPLGFVEEGLARVQAAKGSKSKNKVQESGEAHVASRELAYTNADNKCQGGYLVALCEIRTYVC